MEHRGLDIGCLEDRMQNARHIDLNPGQQLSTLININKQFKKRDRKGEKILRGCGQGSNTRVLLSDFCGKMHPSLLQTTYTCKHRPVFFAPFSNCFCDIFVSFGEKKNLTQKREQRVKYGRCVNEGITVLCLSRAHYSCWGGRITQLGRLDRCGAGQQPTYIKGHPSLSFLPWSQTLA